MGQYLKKAAIGIVLASALVFPVHAGTMKEQLKGFYELEVIGDFGGQSAEPFLPSDSDFKEQLQKLKDDDILALEVPDRRKPCPGSFQEPLDRQK